MKKKSKRPLNPKEKKFFKALVTGVSKRKAAIQANYAESSAGRMGQVITQKYTNRWAELLSNAGLDDKTLANTIVEGTKATKVISAANTDNKEVPDWNSRHLFVNTSLKISAAFPNEKVDHSCKIKTTLKVEFSDDEDPNKNKD